MGYAVDPWGWRWQLAITSSKKKQLHSSRENAQEQWELVHFSQQENFRLFFCHHKACHNITTLANRWRDLVTHSLAHSLTRSLMLSFCHRHEYWHKNPFLVLDRRLACCRSRTEWGEKSTEERKQCVDALIQAAAKSLSQRSNDSHWIPVPYSSILYEVGSPNLSPNLVTNLVIRKFCNKYVTEYGWKFVDKLCTIICDGFCDTFCDHTFCE